MLLSVYVLINDSHVMLLYRIKNKDDKDIKLCAQENCGNAEHKLYLIASGSLKSASGGVRAQVSFCYYFSRGAWESGI